MHNFKMKSRKIRKIGKSQACFVYNLFWKQHEQTSENKQTSTTNLNGTNNCSG